MWSAGNECAYGITLEESLRWTKDYDPTRLTVYESSFYDDKKRKYDYSVIDIYSRMYPALTEVQDYLDSQPDKPFLLLEYCHAMGNGPGDFQDYLEVVESDPVMCGGFVWEWCDHAVHTGTTEDGRAIYYYGGDHGEIIHDGNFCVDGLVSPDRQPHVGLLEFANVHRPVRVAGFDQTTGELRLHNHLDFTDLAGTVSLSYEVTRDGELIEEGTIETLPTIPPRAVGSVNCNIPVPESGRCYLKVTYHSLVATELVPAGHVLGFDEVPLEVADPRNQTALELLPPDDQDPPALDVQADERFITISGASFEYVNTPHGRHNTLLVIGVMVFADCLSSGIIVSVRETNHWSKDEASAFAQIFVVKKYIIVRITLNEVEGCFRSLPPMIQNKSKVPGSWLCVAKCKLQCRKHLNLP